MEDPARSATAAGAYSSPEEHLLRRRGRAWISARASRPPLIHTLTLALVTALLLLLWTALAGSVSPTLLPGPGTVWARFVLALEDGTYLPALRTTAAEAAAGWCLAALVAIPLGYLIGRLRALED